MTDYVISNNQNIVDLLKKYVAGDIPEVFSVNLDSFVGQEISLFLKVTGQNYNGTFDSKIMEVLLCNQKKINQIYSLVLYGKIKRLKAIDAKKIRLNYNVSDGSSKVSWENYQEILKMIIEKLSGTQIFLLAIILPGFFVASRYIDDQNLIKKAKIEHQNWIEKEKLVIQAFEKISEDHSNDIKLIMQTQELFKKKLFELTKNADAVEYSGIKIKSAPPIIEQKKLIQKKINDHYKILKIGVENEEYFSVKLENVKTGNKFNARIDNIINQPEELGKLNQAFFSRHNLYLEINARFEDNDLKDAWVISIP
jgi:hypothetical protein